ncbi:hypothetical protein KC19_1G007800 [Ceratodon purpureus]|uniref:Secreted protein n=1 Tax=Ceratodon purpureus TaxID=3225 RepID=A0A8T0J2E7_CERPU|nr:hypothetical protein KC19_1G007800 [Ceratodon purpureus]
MCSLKFAVLQVGSVIALVKVTYDLACQIRLRGVDGACRDIVSTDWWNEKVSCVNLQCAEGVGACTRKETLDLLRSLCGRFSVDLQRFCISSWFAERDGRELEAQRAP